MDNEMKDAIKQAINDGKAVPNDRVEYELASGIKGIGIVLEYEYEYDCFYVSHISGEYENEADEALDEPHSLVYARIGERYHIIKDGGGDES